MTIQSRPSNDEYREGWDRIFGAELAEGLEAGREAFKARQTARPQEHYILGHDGFKGQHFAPAEIIVLNPNDATEHPPAD